MLYLASKHLALRVHILDGIKLIIAFSNLSVQEHISEAVHDELKRLHSKNVAVIVIRI
jgi:hypothetical protein